jgi:hypothetical protein
MAAADGGVASVARVVIEADTGVELMTIGGPQQPRDAVARLQVSAEILGRDPVLRRQRIVGRRRVVVLGRVEHAHRHVPSGRHRIRRLSGEVVGLL